MSNIRNLSEYFGDALTYKMDGKEYVMDESSKAYVDFKKAFEKMSKSKKEIDDMEMFRIMFKYGFGEEKGKELIDKQMPLKVYMKMAEEMGEAWAGRKLNIPS